MTEVTTENTKGDFVPLCVDLDGTLIQSDLLLESAIELVRLNVLYIFILPLWLIKGKAYLKQKIADLVDLEIDSLPFNEKFLQYLKKEKGMGRILILL